MTDALTPAPTDAQLGALEQLRDLALESDAFELVGTPLVEADGRLRIDFSLDCSQTATAPSGLQLHARERFIVRIPERFPYGLPEVSTPHTRWRGVPHVQWGRVVCLYASPSTEWNPAEGMQGLVRRLILWLRRGAEGLLDPDDMPLHPPVAYVTAGSGLTVVRGDLVGLAPTPDRTARIPLGDRREPTDASPPTESEPDVRFVVALCRRINLGRFDVLDWLDYDVWRSRAAANLSAPRVGGEDFGVLAVLAPRELAFEYPHSLGELFSGIESLHVERSSILVRMAVIAWTYRRQLAPDAPSPSPASALHLFIGTPSRRGNDGILKQHLVCWRLDEIGGQLIGRITELLGSEETDDATLNRIVSEVGSWVLSGTTTWVSVQEDRPEVTLRRDDETGAAWLRGKRVLVLGAGALGALVSEWVVRAGAAAIEIVDNDTVSPGILVRQPYLDGEIGQSKASALASRLQQIRPGVLVEGVHVNAITWCLHEHGAPPGFHLIVDATADASVSSALEGARAHSRSTWPPVLSMVIGHEAQRGVITVSQTGATGAGRDILRRLALRARMESSGPLARLADDIFPATPRERPFQPEPGCSSPTFRGSAAQVAALAGHLFDAGLRALAGLVPPDAQRPMSAACVALGASDSAPDPQTMWMGWGNDAIVCDDVQDYEVRVSHSASAVIRSECRRGARIRPPDFETGGSLFGEIDEAVRCIWIDAASGPPPDSYLSPLHFEHGTIGVKDLVDYHRKRSGGLSSYLGIWHSHPDGPARPSPTDDASMDLVVTPALGDVWRALFLIVGGEDVTWTQWLETGDSPSLFAHVSKRTGVSASRVASPPLPSRHRAIAVRGGWTRPPQGHRTRTRWLSSILRRRRRQRSSS